MGVFCGWRGMSRVADLNAAFRQRKRGALRVIKYIPIRIVTHDIPSLQQFYY